MTMLRRMQMRSLALMLAAMAAVPMIARAENDADRVPADAVAYIHWAGEDALGGQYAASHMKGLLDTLKLRETLTALMEKHVGKLEGPQKEKAQFMHDFLETAVKYPTSVYVGTVDLSNPDKPLPTIAIFSKMGAANAGEYADKLNAVAADAKDKSVPFSISAVGEYLLVTIGADSDMAKRLATVPPTDGLGSTEDFNKTMMQFGPGAAEAPAIVYINGEAALHVIDDLIATKGRGGQAWPAAETALGFTEIRQIAWAGNFDGPEWVGQFFIGMGQNRTGLLDFLDNKPLSNDALKLIPANATWAGALPFDGSRFLDDMRNAAGQIDPRGQQNFDFALRQFFAFSGVDLKKDLLGSLGTEFTYFTFPDAAGKSATNLVMATKLKNAQKMDTALSTLENTVNALIMQRDSNSPVQFKTEALDAPDDKITAHLLTLPQASPAWAIQGDVLYVGISKSAVQHAIDNGKAGGGIAENPAFAALRKQLGDQQMSGFGYLDLPKVAPEDYDVIKGLLEEWNVPYTLPPLAALSPHLTPYMKVSWTDAAGFHVKSIGSFPFSGDILSPYQVTVQKLRLDAMHESKQPATAPATQEKLP
jgi:hypothetical protein